MMDLLVLQLRKDKNGALLPCCVCTECMGSPALFGLEFRLYKGVSQRQPFLLSAGEDLFLLFVSIHNRDGGEVVKR